MSNHRGEWPPIRSAHPPCPQTSRPPGVGQWSCLSVLDALAATKNVHQRYGIVRQPVATPRDMLIWTSQQQRVPLDVGRLRCACVENCQRHAGRRSRAGAGGNALDEPGPGGRQAETSSIRNSARSARYLAAVRLPSDPCMTARPSVVHRYHLQARPRFLSRISKSGSCSGNRMKKWNGRQTHQNPVRRRHAVAAADFWPSAASSASNSVRRSAAIFSNRSRSATVFMACAKRCARAICSSRNSLLLAMASSCFDALSHGPMRGAVVCYGSGNLKGSKPSGPPAVRFLVSSPAIGGRALIGDGLGELGAEEEDLRRIVRPEHEDDQRAGRAIG